MHVVVLAVAAIVLVFLCMRNQFAQRCPAAFHMACSFDLYARLYLLREGLLLYYLWLLRRVPQRLL